MAVSFTPENLLRRLRQLQGDALPSRYLVGFSGGLDSTVLLHALATTRDLHRTPVVAVHVNHGLHPAAVEWEQRCRRVAGALDLDFVARRVSVADEGFGLEAALRKARYAACLDLVTDGDVFLSAHHQEDQAETLLLNLMRGSGLAGLAAIGARQPFGPGRLIRPLLDVSQKAIMQYASRRELDWIADPSNEDLRFDRNFLRHEILPRLRERWPAAPARLAHSAGLAGEAAGLLEELARLDLAGLAEGRGETPRGRPDRIDVAGLLRLGPSRRRNVLRYAIRACGLPPAPSSRLRQLQEELLPARSDRQPLVRWPGAEARRYRGRLYLIAADLHCAPEAAGQRLFHDGRRVVLGPGLGSLRLETAQEQGIDPAAVDEGLEIRFRQGGETLMPQGHEVTRPLKKLLQERGIVPWLRHCVPLLYAGQTLVAVADLWIARDYARENGLSVRWDGKPALFHAD